MLEKRLEVKADGKPIYDIVIRDNFEGLSKELESLDIQNRRLCIVTESNVASLYLQEVTDILKDKCALVEHFIFEAGEKNKNLDTVNYLYQFLIEHKFDRNDMLLALGGGVTGDLTGFAAATYLRGIEFVQIPTSLLSQVDSSIGGKTGVDFLAYKNMVGAFYMPKLVYINIKTLLTLDERQYHSGLGEVIKHGLIRDKDYYRWILTNREAIAAKDLNAMAVMVEGSCKIKRAVVEEDPKEHGIRAYLNFGHTLGHSIEKISNFRLAHGECVGIGAILAAKMSLARGYISEEDMKGIEDIFEYFEFPKLPEGMDVSRIVEATHHDKKMEHGIIKFVLLNKIGEAAIYRDVTDLEMAAVLK